MRILVLDIETAPNLAHVWGLWNQNVGLPQLLESGRVICFAAKWVGQKRVMFYSEHDHGHEAMVTAAHALLDEADVVVHYNGKKFDVPWLNSEFMRYGLEPPSPFKQVDLLTVVRQGRFPSNKLDAIAKELGLVGKVKHEGHVLWIKCLLGDPAAWRQMKRYNVQDVRLTEELYHRLLPWIKNHPSRSLYDEGQEGCLCGSTNLERRGYAYTTVSRFQQFRCRDCGRWTRSGKAESRVDLRPST